jgi:type II secretory pathway component PulF
VAKFIYKAKRGLDETFEGGIEADSRDDAVNKLVARGLFPVEIREDAAAKKEPQKARRRPLKRSRKISSREILLFTQKLTTLMRARVELIASLKILYEQTDNSRFQEVILEIYNITKEGKPLSESLAQFPAVFSGLFVNIIRAGEASGRLDAALEQISDFLLREESLKTKVRVALAYPTLLLLVGLLSIFVLMNFVVPRLRAIFEGMGRQLPLITKIVLNISMISNRSWWLILGGLGLLSFVLYRRKGAGFFSHMIRNIVVRMPLLKRLAHNQELAHFSRALTLLLKSGVPALKSLETATPAIEDPKLRKNLQETCQSVASGQSIAKSMETLTSLPAFFVKMIAVGEESGRLTEVLEEISSSYVQQIEADITLITSILEPILILFLGLVLGAIVLAILLPTFQMTQVIH